MSFLFPWGWIFVKLIGALAHPGSRVESHLYCSPIKVGSKIQNRPNVSPALNLSGRDFSTSPRLLYITFFPKIYIDWIPWVYIGLWILLLWNNIITKVFHHGPPGAHEISSLHENNSSFTHGLHSTLSQGQKTTFRPNMKFDSRLGADIIRGCPQRTAL